MSNNVQKLQNIRKTEKSQQGTNGQTDKRTNGRTDGPTDGPTDRVT